MGCAGSSDCPLSGVCDGSLMAFSLVLSTRVLPRLCLAILAHYQCDKSPVASYTGGSAAGRRKLTRGLVVQHLRHHPAPAGDGASPS